MRFSLGSDEGREGFDARNESLQYLVRWIGRARGSTEIQMSWEVRGGTVALGEGRLASLPFFFDHVYG